MSVSESVSESVKRQFIDADHSSAVDRHKNIAKVWVRYLLDMGKMHLGCGRGHPISNTPNTVISYLGGS